jgi:dienelactone hydrolase
MEQRARARGEDPKPTPGASIQAYLAKPEGSGPFPAIVVSPGCAGLTAYLKEALPQRLASWGYVALVIDSLTSRKIEPNCVKETASVDRVADLFGGLFHLAALPFVDRNRVGVMGMDRGAEAVLTLVGPLPEDWVFNPERLTFKAGVIYYPMCAEVSEKRRFPLLLQIGQLDQRSAARVCENLAERKAGDSAPIELAVYPDAHHGFDEPQWGAGQDMFGYRTEYNQKAAEDALSHAQDFLARNLSQSAR